MNKKLTVKTQKLVKTLPTSAKSFASSICIEPEEAILNEKKGTIYTIFDLTCTSEIDPLLITKIIHDVLYESYYESETASPIQSLERSIATVREKIINLIDSKTRSDSLSSFNMLAAVLWGNVLYMVQFGKGGSYLVRDNVVKVVNAATEGNFSVASGVIKDDDVVVLGTQSFIAKYSAEDLISGNVSFSMYELSETAAAILLKFDVVAELTEDERIDFTPVSEISAPTRSHEQERRTDYKTPTNAENYASEVSKPYSVSRGDKLPKISLIKARSIGFRFSKYYFVIGLLFLGFASSVFWMIQQNKKQPELVNAPSMTTDSSQKSLDTNLATEANEASSEENDEKYKISRVNPKFFYDVKLVDNSASPSEIAALDSDLVVSDKTSGKLYWSSSTTPKFEQKEQFAGISGIEYFGGDLVFLDSEGYKVYDPVTDKVSETYKGTISGPFASYLAFVYGASDGKITKYQLLGTELSGSTWAESSDFSGAKSVAVDGSIYVLKSDSVVKYFSGKKEAFNLSPLDIPLNNAIKIIKTVDTENVYIADSGNKRVLITDDSGNVIKQIVANGTEFQDIRSISLSPDEKMLYVLSESKVYEVVLE